MRFKDPARGAVELSIGSILRPLAAALGGILHHVIVYDLPLRWWQSFDLLNQFGSTHWVI